MTAPVPEATADRVVLLYEAHSLPLKAVAARTRISVSTARMILVRRGIPRRPVGIHPAVPTAEASAEIIRLRREGLSLRAIERRTGVSRSRVHQVIVLAGAVTLTPLPATRPGGR